MWVRETKNGKWQALVKVGDRRRSVTRETKREALRAGQKIEAEMLGPDPDERVWSSNPTVAAACEMQMRTGGYAPTLAAEYRRAVDRIPVELGRMRLGEVRVPDVEAAYRSLARAGVKPFGIRRVHELLRVTFAEAVRLGILPSSPIPAARPPAKPERDVRPPTPAEVRAILDAAEPGPARTAFAVAAATGARRGELAALRWSDIDLDLGRVSIVRSLAYAPWSGVHERPTKTGRKGHRVVSIAGDLVHRAGLRTAEAVDDLGGELGSRVLLGVLVDERLLDRRCHGRLAAEESFDRVGRPPEHSRDGDGQALLVSANVSASEVLQRLQGQPGGRGEL